MGGVFVSGARKRGIRRTGTRAFSAPPELWDFGFDDVSVTKASPATALTNTESRASDRRGPDDPFGRPAGARRAAASATPRSCRSLARRECNATDAVALLEQRDTLAAVLQA